MLKTSSVSPFSFVSHFISPSLSGHSTQTLLQSLKWRKSQKAHSPPPSKNMNVYEGHEGVRSERVTSILRPPIHNLLFLTLYIIIWLWESPRPLLEITKGLNLFFLGIFGEANLIPRISPSYRQVPFNGYK